MASSSCSISCFMSLEDLDVGVVKTFHPTDSDLVGSYLYNKIKSPTPIGGKQTFPEIEIYGTTGLPPWDIWRIYEPSKFPHQDYIYFFSRVKKLGSRCSRRIGCDGGTWSETEAAKPVYVSGIEEPYGKLRKFRYENNKHKGFEHHAAWLMDEFTINQAPDLALCRLKVNDKGGGRKKRKKSSDETNEDENVRSKKCLKNRKVEPRRDQTSFMCEQQQEGSASFASTTSQLILSPYHHEDDQVVQVVPENSDDYDELQQILFSDDDCMDENLMFSPTILFDDAQLMASVDQSIAIEQQQQQDSDYSLAPQQQLEPDNRCQEEDQIQQQQQQQQQDQPSSSHSHEQQQLIGDDDLMIYGQHDYNIPLDNDFLWSDEFNGLFTHEDQLGAVPWRDSDDQFQYSDIL